jgi:hypothetical protein
MAEMNLEAALRSLRKSLEQIKALLAWEQLKQSEARPGHSPMLAFDNSIETDLRNEYSFFLSTSVQMHSILNSGTAGISRVKLQRIKQELARIERQLFSLDLQQRRYS